MQSDDAEPKFVTSFQYQHDHITMSDAQTLKVGCCLICILFYIRKRELALFTFIIGP